MIVVIEKGETELEARKEAWNSSEKERKPG